jgi:isocitrate/isopropylmalate dehydrogenase
LRHTGKNEAAAKSIEDAIDLALANGFRTADIVGNDSDIRVSTSEMGELITNYAAESEESRPASQSAQV